MVDAHLNGKQITTQDIKNLIIGGQTGIGGIRFVLASSVEGEDLTNESFNWYVQYKNKYGQGESVAMDAVYVDNLVKLEWVPDSLATQVSGRLQIQVYATIIEGEGESAVLTTKWVSEPAVLYVLENLNPAGIASPEPSTFEYYLNLYASYKAAAKAWASAAEDVEVEAGLFSSKHYATKAAALFVLFDSRFLGAKAADPELDNYGAALVAGTIYFNTTSSTLRIYSGAAWGDIVNGAISITYTPAVGMTATNVQAAIDELNTKKAEQTEVDALKIENALLREELADTKQALSDNSNAPLLTTSGYGSANLSAYATGIGKGTVEGISLINLSLANETYAKQNVTLIDGVFHFLPTGDAYITKGAIPFNAVDTFLVYAKTTIVTGSIRLFNRITFTGLWKGVPSSADVLQGTLFDDSPNESEAYMSDITIINMSLAGLASITDTQIKALILAPFTGSKDFGGVGMLWSRGINLWNTEELIDGYFLSNADGSLYTISGRCASQKYFSIPVGTAYIRASFTTTMTLGVWFYDENKNFISGDYNGTILNYSVPNNARYYRYGSASTRTKSLENQAMISFGNTAYPYEPNSEARLFFKGDTLRRLPNGVHDDIVSGVQTKRVTRYTLQTADITSLVTSPVNYDTIAIVQGNFAPAAIPITNENTQGKFKIPNYSPALAPITDDTSLIGKYAYDSSYSGALRLIFAKGTYASLAEAQADLAGTVIEYQIATPVITNIQSFGKILAKHSGSVVYLPHIVDAGLYDAGFSITDTTRPIESIDSLYKVDSSGTNIMITDAMIDGDGLGFTSANLSSGDLILLEYSFEEPLGVPISIQARNDLNTIVDETTLLPYTYKPRFASGVLVGWALIAI